MQDDRGNWRQVERMEGDKAFDAAGELIGSTNERPVLGYQEKVKVILSNGQEIHGTVIACVGAVLHVHTAPGVIAK